MRIHQILSEIVKDSGESQYKWADKSGMSQPQLCRFLTGKKDIKVATLETLIGGMNPQQREQFYSMLINVSPVDKTNSLI